MRNKVEMEPRKFTFYLFILVSGKYYTNSAERKMIIYVCTTVNWRRYGKTPANGCVERYRCMTQRKINILSHSLRFFLPRKIDTSFTCVVRDWERIGNTIGCRCKRFTPTKIHGVHMCELHCASTEVTSAVDDSTVLQFRRRKIKLNPKPEKKTTSRTSSTSLA